MSKKDPSIIWLRPYLDPRKAESRTDVEWERIWRQRVKANEARRERTNLFRPDEEVPAFLKLQAE